MAPIQIAELLDASEGYLNGVSQSMLRADLPALEDSQIVLSQLVQRFLEMKQTIESERDSIPRETRCRLETLRLKLAGLHALSEAAGSAIGLRSQLAGTSESGYTTGGIKSLNPDFRTISLEY